MIRYHAAWLVPIANEPIHKGWLTVDHGRIVALGRRAANDPTPGVELGDVAVMPGLVNAHTHLGLARLFAIGPRLRSRGGRGRSS
jgi:imidazolonepropionase-like amidohydrolase